MVYLEKLTLPTEQQELQVVMGEKRTVFNTGYPFKVFPVKELRQVEFAPITIFCGGNGSGKTTLLNILGQKLNAMRHSQFNDSPFFVRYVELCSIRGSRIPGDCQLLTSDDVFDYMLQMRSLNAGIDSHREQMVREYADMRRRVQLEPEYRQLKGLDDYDRWKEVLAASSRHKTQSQFLKERVARNIDLYSNGETAMRYFTERIDRDTVYLLDEPENSLSIAHQKTLAQYLYDAARYFGCQIIMATHSPVLLAIQGARIYDLDSIPVTVKKWTELENVRAYFDFFEAHRNEFMD